MTDKEIAELYADTIGALGQASIVVCRREDGMMIDGYGVSDSECANQLAFDWLARNYPGIQNKVSITPLGIPRPQDLRIELIER